MPESSAIKSKMFETEVKDFFTAYESVLKRTTEDCQRLLNIVTAHPKYRKGFGVDDIKSGRLYASCLKIVEIWAKMDVTDDELETTIEDFGIDPKELTCEEEEATESTCLLGDVAKEKKKSFFNTMFNNHKEARRKKRLSRKPKVPEEPNVVKERRKTICENLEAIVREEFDGFRKKDEVSKDSPDASPKQKPSPVRKDLTEIKLDEMAKDAQILYYAAKTLTYHRDYSLSDVLDYLKCAYEMKTDRSFQEQPSKIIGREMDNMLKSKLCFEIMKVVMEDRIRSEKLFAECEKYYEEQHKGPQGAEGGAPKDDKEKPKEKSSRKRTTDDEPPQTATASPAKQPKKAPGSSQQELKSTKLVDVPTPTKEPPKDIGTRRKQKRMKIKNVVISPPRPDQKAGGSDQVPFLPPPPSQKRSSSVPAQMNKPTEVSLIDLNSPEHEVQSESDMPEEQDLIDFQSPRKLPEDPTKKSEDNSDDENSTGVTKQLGRTSVDDQ